MALTLVRPNGAHQWVPCDVASSDVVHEVFMNTMANVKVHLRTRRGNVNITVYIIKYVKEVLLEK